MAAFRRARRTLQALPAEQAVATGAGTVPLAGCCGHHAERSRAAIGARDDPEQAYDIHLQPEKESEGSADIFRQLRFAQSRHPVERLLRAEWR